MPPCLTIAAALWFLGNLTAPRSNDFAFGEFGNLPVISNGRVMPMDSLARLSLLEIHGKQTLNTKPWEGSGEKPKIVHASEWLANVMMNPRVADEWPVFSIDHPELISLLRLPEKDPANRSDGRHFSWDQIRPSLRIFGPESERVRKIEQSKRSAYENAVLKLHRQCSLYTQLKNSIKPADTLDWAAELSAYDALIPAGIAATRLQRAGGDYDRSDFVRFSTFIVRYQYMASLQPPLVLPPELSGEWRRMGDALLGAPRENIGGINQVMRDYASLTTALVSGDAFSFNSSIKAVRLHFIPAQEKALANSHAEVIFNHLEPFYKALVLYLVTGLLAVFSWFNQSETLRKSAVWLVWLAFAIHSIGLILRMVLEGRPPVTNLYSSAVFIGWAAVLLGLILERFYRNGIGVVASSTVGFTTLIIAHHLALEGDTMEMMRAVLDTNFWLATHVVAVTLGYASTFVAGILAVIYIVRGVFTKTLDEATGMGLSRMIYGIVCFATLFSFVGTVLGGIWADQSWGRFWGWDPKENGALIIVLWNALILHLRWGGMIRERGMANCAVFGNIVTAWSWFGVNLLGIGLHSYGFTTSGWGYLGIFAISQLLLIGNGLLPVECWRSRRESHCRSGRTIFKSVLLCDILWIVGGVIWFLGIILASTPDSHLPELLKRITGVQAIYPAQLNHLGMLLSLGMCSLIWLLSGTSSLIRALKDPGQTVR